MRMVLSLDSSVLILITRRNPNVSLTLSSRAPRGVPGGPPSSSSCGGQMRMNLLLGALFAAICVFGGVTEGGIQS